MTELINKQDAINICDKYSGYMPRRVAQRVWEEMKELPPAQPERKKGYWVSQKGGGYCCSECGRYALDEVDGNFIHVAFESNFCPYCGAKMVRNNY